MSKINKNTHKVFLAKYIKYEVYAVPNAWEMEYVHIRRGILYHKDGERIEDPVELDNDDFKHPDEVTEADIDEYEMFFDCEDDTEVVILS